MELNTVIIIAIGTVSVCANIASAFYIYRQNKTTEADVEGLIKRTAVEADIDILYNRITNLHGRIANLEKRIEPIGFQEVLTKHADEIAIICCREYGKLFKNSHDERGNTDNNG